jgi:hypothetical protein
VKLPAGIDTAPQGAAAKPKYAKEERGAARRCVKRLTEIMIV